MQRGTASGIVKVIERSVTSVMKMPDILSRLIALGSDGACVILGHNAGVFTLLKEIQSAIIAVALLWSLPGTCLQRYSQKNTISRKSCDPASRIILYISEQSIKQNQSQDCILMSEYESESTYKSWRNQMDRACTMST